MGILWWLAAEGPSMYDLTIDEFPPDRLAAIVHWCNNPAVNRYLRQGILTLETVQAWYTQYFSRAEHQLFAVYADKTLIGYGTLSHIDPTHRSCEIVSDHRGTKGANRTILKSEADCANIAIQPSGLIAQ